MTKRECAIVLAYTWYCMLSGLDIDLYYKYLEEKIGRQVYTHEMYELADEIKEKSKDDFLELCKNATDEENEKEKTDGEDEREKILNMIDEEIKKLQPSYKHIAIIKLLQSIREKI